MYTGGLVCLVTGIMLVLSNLNPNLSWSGEIFLSSIDTGAYGVNQGENTPTATGDSPKQEPLRVEAAVIRPFRQVTISAQVAGTIERTYVEEGDKVKSGQMVLEISPDLFALNAKRAEERLSGLEVSFRRAKEQASIRESLFAHGAATEQEILTERTNAEIAGHRVNEAKIDLDLALRDLRLCKVEAPFSGYIVTLYRESHESVQRFEQLFLIADTSRVYAVANVPESIMRLVCKGSCAFFVRPSGNKFAGQVYRIATPIDPSSKTKKVHILIDNAKGDLEMGMIGAVELIPGKGVYR